MCKIFCFIATVLLIVGGLNWGLVGLFNFNLVSTLFGETPLTRIIYIVVGAAAVFQAFSLTRCSKDSSCKTE